MDKPFAIFDMDGTLADSMDFWTHLGEEYLRRQGIAPPPDIWDTLKALTMPQAAQWLVRTFGLPGTAAGAEAEMSAVMADHYRRDVPLKPGAREYLAALRDRGVGMCLATNTPSPLVRACLSRLGVLDLFRFCISGEEVGAGKDKPDIYLAAAERLGGAPRDVAVYEDALFALQTAKAAGFYTMGVFDEACADDWPAICRLSDETVRDWKTAR